MTGDPRITPAREDLAADYLRSVVKVAGYAKGVPKQVRLPYAPLHKLPDTATGRLTEALMGEAVTVYEEKGGWSWCQLAADRPACPLLGVPRIDIQMDPALGLRDEPLQEQRRHHRASERPAIIT